MTARCTGCTSQGRRCRRWVRMALIRPGADVLCTYHARQS